MSKFEQRKKGKRAAKSAFNNRVDWEQFPDPLRSFAEELMTENPETFWGVSEDGCRLFAFNEDEANGTVLINEVRIPNYSGPLLESWIAEVSEL
ncbi:hypothetical protein [Coraliomargarita sinensis]|nr:hypothetical protein [Coraliomargarita sinensis]